MPAFRPARSLGGLLIIVGSLLPPAAASAQTVLERRTPEPWVPLVSIPGIQDVGDIPFSGADDGDADLNLPFTFHFMLQPFVQVTVGTNGLVVFDGYATSTGNSSMGSSSGPDNMIAPWWDDLVLPAASGFGTYGTYVSGQRRAFVIEVRDFEAYPATGNPEGSWQVWLWEGTEGRFDVRYDGVLTAGQSYDATAGWEGPVPSSFGTYTDCTSYCDEEDFLELVGYTHTVQLAPGPDLVGTIGTFPLGSRPGESVSGRVTLQNLGADSTGTVASSLYMSADSTIDAADRVVYTLIEPQMLAGAPVLERDLTFTVPAGLPDGDYNLIFRVDSNDAHAEFDETNNIVIAETFFATTGTPTFVQTERPERFVPLAQMPDVANLTDLSFTEIYNNERRPSMDDADDEAVLPFTFNFLGRRHDTVRVGTSGLIVFGPRADYTSNRAMGSSYAPNGIIAPWWDDLYIQDPDTAGSYGTVGVAPNRVVVIEVRGFERYQVGPNPEGSWQVWLYEGPEAKFEVRYDGNISAGENYSATPGWEGPAGDDVFGHFRACGEGYPYCDEVEYATMRDHAFTVQKATGAELIGAIGTFEGGGLPGTTVAGEILVRNIGGADARDVNATLYLSADGVLDASDTPAGDVVVPLVAAGAGDVTAAASVTVPFGFPAGLFNLILQIDPQNLIPESEELNNISVSAEPIVTGHDVRATALAGTSGVPQQRATFSITIDNGAVPYAGALGLRVVASTERIYDVNDPLITDRTVVLLGDPSESFELEVTLPALPPGPYFPIVIVDPQDRVLEHDDFNNVLAATTPLIIGPELAIDQIVVPQQASPGDAIEVDTSVVSGVGAFVGNVRYRLWSSADATLDTSDLDLGTFMVVFNGEAVIVDRQTVTLPLSVSTEGVNIIAEVDPDNLIIEANELNNAQASSGRIVTAPDFSVAQVSFTPGRVRHGTAFTIDATFTAEGLLYTGSLGFRVWLSTDGTVSGGARQPRAGDVPLVAATTTVQGNVVAAGTATVAIGSTLPVADWYVFVEVDPDSRVAESSEDNNWGRATGRLRMDGPNLRVVSVSGPSSAFIGSPYMASVTIDNDGTAPAGPFSYGYFVSVGGAISATSPQLFASGPVTLAPGARRTFNDAVDVSGLTPGPVEIAVMADFGAVVSERDEGDNVRTVPGFVDVLQPGPDLAALSLTITGTGATAGGSVAVTRTFDNRGTAAAAQFEYRFYLSVNPTIASDDLVLGGRATSLDVGVTDSSVEIVDIPANVPAGRYFIGLALDPADNVREVFEDNNTVVGPRLAVAGDLLAVSTERVPDAMLGASFEATLAANGGPFAVRWSIVRGSLPSGLQLDASRGRIFGTPTEEATGSVTFRASTGAATADRALVLRVLRSTTPVLIVERLLPAGVVGTAYCVVGAEVLITATGGTPPYVFRATEGLPVGMTLSSDGRLCGTPRASGAFDLVLVAEDRSQRQGTATFALSIGDKLRVSLTELPAASINTAYTAQLEASGGTPPYLWAVGAGALPPGLTIDDAGAIAGTPTSGGTFAFNAEVTGSLGQLAVRPLSIRVAGGDTVEDESSCTCVAAASRVNGGWLFLLAGLVALVRRRRESSALT